jgi:hypothetical protein
MPWECFLIEAVRPFVEFFTICQGGGNGHRVVHEVIDGVEFDAATEPTKPWPTHCPQCGIEFDTSKSWTDGGATLSRMGGHVYRRPDTGEEHTRQHEFGAGAMFDATEWSTHHGPDGKAWGVVLPPGGVGDLWLIDGVASGGGRWTRSGEPPKLTVSPSILTPKYHGFLEGGVLTDSLPDRPLP